MKYLFADFKIEIEEKFPDKKKSCDLFLTEFEESDFSFSISKEELIEESQNDIRVSGDAYLEFIAMNRKLAEWLPLNNAFLLHSAVFDVSGVGVAFAALSGTGKTTHMRLWKELLGEKMVVVNGDKPIVRFFDDEPDMPYAYGNPWNGKEHFGRNMRTPLKHICFIERSGTNFVEKMNKADAVNLIFNQVYMPKDSIAVMNTMQLIDRLLSCCNLWKIHCNMELDAAKIAYDTIFKP